MRKEEDGVRALAGMKRGDSSSSTNNGVDVRLKVLGGTPWDFCRPGGN
jgi:hypothetical protein